MGGDGGGCFAGASSGRRLMDMAKRNGLVVALSAAGVSFILLGILALALPTSREGIFIVQLDSSHALYLMDVAGIINLGIGVVLTWLGGKLWSRHLHG
jgi:hypothetical protein